MSDAGNCSSQIANGARPKTIEIPSVGKYQDDYHQEEYFRNLSNTDSSVSFDLSRDEGFFEKRVAAHKELNQSSSSYVEWSDYFHEFHGEEESKGKFDSSKVEFTYIPIESSKTDTPVDTNTAEKSKPSVVIVDSESETDSEKETSRNMEVLPQIEKGKGKGKSSKPSATVTKREIKKERIPHDKKDFEDLSIGKYTQETLDRALQEIRNGRTYASVSGEFHISKGTLSNWANKKVNKKGTGPSQRVSKETEELFANFLEETWLNLSPKYKKQFLEEANYYLDINKKLSSMGNVLVTFHWLDGLQERQEKAELISMKDAAKYSEENCTDVAQWTAIRRKHLDHVVEPFLPMSMKQVFLLDLVKLVSGPEPHTAFESVIAYVGSGEIMKIYLTKRDGLEDDIKELWQQNFGLLLKRNGEITGTSLSVIIHDIER